MFDYLQYRIKLRKFSNIKKKAHDTFSKEIREAYRKKESSEEINRIQYGEFFEVTMAEEEISTLITNYLRKKAYKLFVPLPEFENEQMWTQCNKISDQKVLTYLGINTVTKAIREERKGKVELFLMIITSLTGIIGAIIGLIAIIKR